MSKQLSRCLIVVLVATLALAGLGGVTAAQTTLKMATHWDSDDMKGLLEEYIAEYEALHPHINIEYEAVPFEDFFTRLQVSTMAGDAPDLMHIYSLWGAQLEDAFALASPPADVADYVNEHYTPGAVAGATVNDQLYGFPTEVNTYLLVYNKRLLAEAGYTEPPQTWDELVEIATATTKRNQEGQIVQAGFAFMRGWDSAVVHPWSSLLYAEGGKMFSDDFSESLLDSPEALRALEMQLELFEAGATDETVSLWDFPTGTIAMIIMAPFYGPTLVAAMGDAYDDVAVAPIPAGSAGQATTQYSWFWAVHNQSRNQEEAWKFLSWLNGERAGGEGTRMGDVLIDNGILPGHRGDLEHHAEHLSDAWNAPFVESLDYARSEPNVYQGQEIKTILMREIEAAWFGQKSAEQALADAKRQIDRILREFY